MFRSTRVLSLRAWSAVASALLVTVAGNAAPVVAQRNVALTRFRPALDPDGFLALRTSRTPGPGQFSFQLSVDWAVDPLSVGPEDTPVVTHQVVGWSQFQVGVGERLALAFEAPLLLHQSGAGERLQDGLGPLVGSAGGNPAWWVRVRLAGDDAEGGRLPEGLGVSWQSGLSLPLGARQTFAADSEPVLATQFTVDYHLLGGGVGLMIGGRFHLDDQKAVVAGSRFQHALDVVLGAKVPVFVVRDLFGMVELRWTADLSEHFGLSGPTNTLEGAVGVRYVAAPVTWTVSAGTEFVSGLGSPALRVVFAVAWAPRVADADGDGVPDSQDACSFLGEDRDGFEDEDGCPDPDNDGDLVFDEDDSCPDVAADALGDAGNGCPSGRGATGS